MSNNYIPLPEIIKNGDDPDGFKWMKDWRYLNDKLWIGTAFPTSPTTPGTDEGPEAGYVVPFKGGLCVRTDYSPWKLYMFKPDDYGTAESGTANTITDTGKAWTPSAWATYLVGILDGTGKGQYRTISDNTATALTVSVNWTINPDSTSVYQIYKADDSHWVEISGGGGSANRSIFLMPNEAILPDTDFADLNRVSGTNKDWWQAEFDPTTSQSLTWTFNLDPQWDAGTVYFDIFFMSADVNASNNIQWQIKLHAAGDGDSFDVAPSSLGTITVFCPGVDKQIKIATISGVPTASAGDVITCELSRNPGSDTSDADADLVLIRVRFGVS